MYKGTSGHNQADSFPKNNEMMKASVQGNNGDQMHGPGGQSGSYSQSGSSSQGNFESHKGSGMEHPGQMNQMQKGGARHEAGQDSKNPGMMKQGSDDRKMGSHGDTCPCMRNSGMQSGHDNRYSGNQMRENQDQQPGNSCESGRKMSTQGPGQEKINEGNHGDRFYPGENHCRGFNEKDMPSSHHRFQGSDGSGCSGQTNQEQVYLVVVKQG
jgi:hypothetical protein